MDTVLSASRLNDFLACRHRAALWLVGVEAPEADATVELVRRKGDEHELVVLERLEKAYGPAVRIPKEGAFAARQAATLEAMKRGAPLIYQGAFKAGVWIGYPDFLVRDGEARAIAYRPEDAKLARTMKPEHALQLGVYQYLLEETHGRAAGKGVIHVDRNEPQRIDLTKTRFITRRLMRGFEDFVAGGGAGTRATPCSACRHCDYAPICEDSWRKADSPFFVAGAGAGQVMKLEAAGVATLAALAEVKPGVRIPGMGSETLAKLAAQARLQRHARESGQHMVELLPVVPNRGFHLLPEPHPGDLFFDMEGDPLYEDGLEYLFGIWGDFGEGERFSAAWGHDRVGEKTAFEATMRRLCAQMERHPSAHIYHYAQYEPNALKRLAMRHATMEAELDRLLREQRFVDLYRVVKQSLRASTESYSLKDLEKIYWGERSGEVTNAADSIVEYERWRALGDQDILDSIESYNKEDCISTVKMRDWLSSLRPPGAGYMPRGGQVEEDAERSAEREAREQRRQDLAARVRASAVADPRLRDLIAELLWFHQRADKPGWWSYYERQSWDAEELVEDSESVGGLVLDSANPPYVDKRSYVARYRFPPQETKLKAGDQVHFAETGERAGALMELDVQAGTLVLRRGVKQGAFPQAAGLITRPLGRPEPAAAVEAFAERFLLGAAERAVMDILLRRAPRLHGKAPDAPIVAADEVLVDGAVRAVKALDESYLFIQGPPGAGKTYTGAHLIVALLKSGKRVGVSSNSHKAINKLLEEVERRAAEQKVRFRGAKKGNKDKEESWFDSAHVRTVFASDEADGADQLVGGTVYHFARADQLGTFDYLFIDEAGQVALGNLVAMGGAAKNIVLIGDQMQLPQPVQGVHPGESGVSSLQHLLEERATAPPERGIFLDETWRLHPRLCGFISDAIYDRRLKAHESAAKRRLVAGSSPEALPEAGLVMRRIAHEGCRQSSVEEAEAIAALVEDLLKLHIEDEGVRRPLTLEDILVVAPYNMQVNLLRETLPAGARIGTVDKFQGQEAAVAILSMAASAGEEAPRGAEFLFNRNRFNVAVSRAQCVAVVVCSTRLLDGAWRKLSDLERLDLFAHAEHVAQCG
ncbi:MAG: hypothetical protein BroJett013_36390 [Alphaproteobacteria bacterium]|nr:MAG: hypothetical protein BroJett013_36390 [Alphaproteobacteria bacterium]